MTSNDDDVEVFEILPEYQHLAGDPDFRFTEWPKATSQADIGPIRWTRLPDGTYEGRLIPNAPSGRLAGVPTARFHPLCNNPTPTYVPPLDKTAIPTSP